MTNGDRIREMTDNELVDLMENTCPEKIMNGRWEHHCGEFTNCFLCKMTWIKEEVKNDER